MHLARTCARNISAVSRAARIVSRISVNAINARASRAFSTTSPVWESKIETTETDLELCGLSSAPFDSRISSILMEPIDENEVEIKPDGQVYLPEIKYRRILNKSFGPGAWGMIPVGRMKQEEGFISQEYALFCMGRLVSRAWGEQSYDKDKSLRSIGTALEGCKSNALVRCCKDIGIASDLWDISYIIAWKAKHADQVRCEHIINKAVKMLWSRKDRAIGYPYREISNGASNYSSGQAKSWSKPKEAEAAPKPVTPVPEPDALPEVDMSGAPDAADFMQPLESFEADEAEASPSRPSGKTAAPAADSDFTLDMSAAVPEYMRKLKGKTWAQVAHDKASLEYIHWLSVNLTIPDRKQFARKVLAFLKAQA